MGKTFKTKHYIDIVKWNMIEMMLREKFIKEYGRDIKIFQVEDFTDNDPIEYYVDNLLLQIKLRPIRSTLLDVMQVKSNIAYACYVDISIEEVHYGLNNASASSSVEVLIKSPKTPHITKNRKGRHVDTPISRTRTQPKRYLKDKNTQDSDDMEYKPTGSQENNAAYVPSVSSTSDGHHEAAAEYCPEPLKNNTNNVSPKVNYIPSSVKQNLSSISIASSTDEKKISEFSLSESLDSIKIEDTKPTPKKKHSSQNLFGDDSDHETKSVDIDALGKKYADLPPVAEAKSKIKKPKPGTSRTPASSGGIKRSSSGKLQQTIEGAWTNKRSKITTTTTETKTEKNNNHNKDKPKSKSRKERERERAENIALMEEQTKKNEAQIRAIKESNILMQQQIGTLNKLNKDQTDDDSYEKLKFPELSSLEVEDLFFDHRLSLTNLYESAVKKQEHLRRNLVMALCRIIDQDTLHAMTDFLHQQFPRSQEYSSLSVTHDEIITDIMMPEWAILIFKDKHGLTDEDARKNVEWQGKQGSSLTEDSFMC